MSPAEYREGTTHNCLVRIHHSYYTIVHLKALVTRQCSICDEDRPDSARLLYEVIHDGSGLIKTGFACCPERAFRDAWDEIAEHEAMTEAS